jgi:hypothetical protein
MANRDFLPVSVMGRAVPATEHGGRTTVEERTVTAATAVTQVSQEGESLLARCTRCGTDLRQVEGFDADVALGTLFQHHPASPAAVHRLVVPAGWRCGDKPDTA